MRQPPETRVSAIVVSYHTGARLKECLHALAGDPDVYQIILVDNGNPPEMRDWLRAFEERTPKLIYHDSEANLGFGAGVNRGASLAEGTHFLIINPDSNPRRGSVRALLDAASGQKTPAIIGGRIFNLDGTEARGGRRVRLSLSRAMASLIGARGISLHQDPPPAGPIAVDAISGAFFLISQSDFEQLGGFDEGYFLHFEDIDLCARALQAGGSVIYVPGAGALHYGATSDVPSAFIARHKARSLNRYLRKHTKSGPQRVLARLLVPVIALAFRLRGR